MNLNYEILPDDKIGYCRDICNELMAFQKSKSTIRPELFDSMNFETRMIPSIINAISNYIEVVKDDDIIVGKMKKPDHQLLTRFFPYL